MRARVEKVDVLGWNKSLGSWRSRASRLYWRSRRSWSSQRSLGYQESPASPVAFTSLVFCASPASQGSFQSGGSWEFEGSWASWASWASILGVWFIFALKKKTKNRIACRHTFFLLTGRQGHYLAFRFVYLNLITYITMSIIFNKIQ